MGVVCLCLCCLLKYRCFIGSVTCRTRSLNMPFCFCAQVHGCRTMTSGDDVLSCMLPFIFGFLKQWTAWSPIAIGFTYGCIVFFVQTCRSSAALHCHSLLLVLLILSILHPGHFLFHTFPFSSFIKSLLFRKYIFEITTWYLTIDLKKLYILP